MQTETSYLGFRLPHPFMAGASPFGYYLDTVKRLEDAGWAAVVLHSLFAEQIAGVGQSPLQRLTPDPELREALAPFPAASDYPLGPDEYAEHVSRVKQAVRIPSSARSTGRRPNRRSDSPASSSRRGRTRSS